MNVCLDHDGLIKEACGRRESKKRKELKASVRQKQKRMTEKGGDEEVKLLEKEER